ncbi:MULTISPECIES: hypothetical protein [unclassified Modestobacter]|uniref:hypothetical protein n=1 Tax=unclassified Modestobacter TaxID=2643866 RepID=UPI0022AAF4E8|nr:MULTISPECIES: hypothetical protein [unclassified Modestobacter]MCZ2814056.1 hypothetical protein [Modestobacter sp. VKM Ac-2979]MCZ2844528.1 hypothetical protein [Modestobacter sp. VKM Ac-2980]MCZ2848918.1 hypothetical protein [Modestobacter sp. VKM Ac-2978]
MVFWIAVGAVLTLLLAVAWWLDHSARRRGSRSQHHSDVWYEVREGRRDAEVLSPFVRDNSWTSWNRRNRR